MGKISPLGYEDKYAGFIRLCAETKGSNVKHVLVAAPWVLGDTYEEVIESLSRLAESGLLLHIAGR